MVDAHIAAEAAYSLQHSDGVLHGVDGVVRSFGLQRRLLHHFLERVHRLLFLRAARARLTHSSDDQGERGRG